MGRRLLAGVTGIAGLLAICAPAGADAIDWAGVPAHEIVLFVPGQSSWEWNLSEADHSGGPKMRKGRRCLACHAGEEAKIGDLIASGKKLEPTPLAARATIRAELKLAHDAQQLHLRLEWPEVAKPTAKPMDPERQAMVTLMLDDGRVKAAAVGGCWATCHDDARGMASAAPGSELEKYLGSSRTRLRRSGGGRRYKPAAELEKLLADGEFLEYWQASLRGGGLGAVADGYILEDRHEHASPAVSASAKLEGGRWVVALSRPLHAAGPGRKSIEAGRRYLIGLAIHDDHSQHRFHHVSFERTLVLDSGRADLVAVGR
jgi:cytochrome c-type protein NapC